MLRRIFKVFAAVIVTLALVEAVLFFFGLGATTISDTGKSNYSYLPGTKMVNITEGYSVRTVNKLGFLDRDYTPELKTGGIRMVLLGNSFSEAVQMPVDSTFENRLEDSLSHQLNRPVEIWNLAHNGEYFLDNIATSRIVLHKNNYQYVLVQLNSANLHNIKTSADHVKITDGQISCDLDRLKKHTFVSSSVQFLKAHSITFNLLIVRMRVFGRFLSRLSLKQLTYAQDQPAKDADLSEESTGELTQGNKDYFQFALSYFSGQVAQDSAVVILFTYPVERDPAVIDFYNQSCAKSNARYLDLSKHSELFDSTKYPMQGFTNAKLGYGHLNQYGNRKLAHALDVEMLAIINNTQPK